MKTLRRLGRDARLLPPCLLLAACAAATGERTATAEPAAATAPPSIGATMTPAIAPTGEARIQRFIVFYRPGSGPRGDRGKVPARLARTASASGLSPVPVLEWQRRLAVEADVFTSDRPLDRAEAEALMQAFREDPDVESIEIDGVMRGGPVESIPLPPTRGD